MKRINNNHSKNSIFATDNTECNDNFYKYIVTDSDEKNLYPFIKYITFKNRFVDSGLNEIDLINIIINRLENFVENSSENNPNVDYASNSISDLKSAISNIAKLK